MEEVTIGNIQIIPRENGTLLIGLANIGEYTHWTADNVYDAIAYLQHWQAEDLWREKTPSAEGQAP